MSERYVVKSAIPVETGGARNGERTFTPAVHGFQLFDTLEAKRLPDTFMSRSEAQEECDRRNGR